jgi:hypothetical protein
VEMLVVMGVIAALSSLSYVYFDHSAGRARLTLCKSRLHHLGLGLIMYSSDHRLFYPVGQETSSMVGGKLFNAQPELLNALYPEYIESRETFYCPSDSRPEFTYSPEQADQGHIGYYYFGCQSPPSSPHTSQFLRRGVTVTWPRKLHRTMDPATWVMSDCWLRGEETPHWTYKRGVVYLQLDGTVGMVSHQPRAAFK